MKKFLLGLLCVSCVSLNINAAIKSKDGKVFHVNLGGYRYPYHAPTKEAIENLRGDLHKIYKDSRIEAQEWMNNAMSMLNYIYYNQLTT